MLWLVVGLAAYMSPDLDGAAFVYHLLTHLTGIGAEMHQDTVVIAVGRVNFLIPHHARVEAIDHQDRLW